MKRDKAWLKEKLNTEKYYRETSELKAKTTYGELYDRGVKDGINVALEFVEQLDEPEVTLDKAFEKVAERYFMTKGEIWRHLEWLEAHGGKATYGEPEALSQEWIDEHAQGDYDEWVYTEDLQNLLVPKQEEVDQAYKDGYEKGKEYTFYKGYLEGLADKNV